MKTGFFEWLFDRYDSKIGLGAWLAKKKDVPCTEDFDEALGYIRKNRAGVKIMALFFTAWREWERSRLPVQEEVLSTEETARMYETFSFVQRQFKTPGNPEESEDTESIAVHRFITEPAKVEVTMSLTMNLGNFESATVRRGITVPCYREEVGVVEQRAEKWVSVRIANDMKKMRQKGELEPEPTLGLTIPSIGRDDEEDDDIIV